MKPMDLTAFLDLSEGWVTVYGERDCLLWPALWVQIRTGVDGGAEWRGTYHDEEGCLAVLEAAGGFLAVMERGVAVVGLEEASEPQRGDIAVVRVRVARGEPFVGAICLGDGWAVMSGDGLRMIRAEAVRCWRVP